MEHSSGAVRTACDIQVGGRPWPGRPKMTQKKLTGNDCHECKLMTVNLQDRNTWRSSVRSAVGAAIQLPGRGPTDVDDAPTPACYSKPR